MKSLRDITIQVRLTGKESAMIDSLSEKVYGGASRSDIIRRVVVERFNKAFPQYLQAKKVMVAVGVPKEEITNEQFCEMNGGKVEMTDAGLKCVQLYPSGARSSHMVTNREGILKTFKHIESLRKK